MSRQSAGFLLAALAAGAAGACSALAPTFRPQGGRSGAPAPAIGDAIGTAGPAGRDPSLLGRPRDRATRLPNEGGLDVRRVCRSSSFPRGWIAVSYEGSASGCPRTGPRSADSVATVAVIVRYATATVGTRLDICADQSVPNGWNRVSDEGPGDPGACPQAVRRGDTVVRVERDY